jgi:methionyl-tRNA formyltransferase
MTGGPASGRAADRVRTIFFGSGRFAVPILDALTADPRLDLVGVVSAPDRPAGRSHAMSATPVASRARGLGLTLLQPVRVRAPEAVAEITALAPDLGVLADYGQVIPRSLLDLPRLGVLNVHPSLLPRHRGATPIPAAIAAGDARTGVTIIRMDDGIDTGPIVVRHSWPLDGSERAPDLEDLAAREAAALLTRTLEAWLSGTAAAIPQTPAAATLTRPFRRADAWLDPARPAIDLERQVRAQLPWPGSFVETLAGRVAVLAASVAPGEPGDSSGQLVRHGDRLALATRAGRLVLDEVQLAGKRPLGGEEFLRGQARLVGTRVLEPADANRNGSGAAMRQASGLAAAEPREPGEGAHAEPAEAPG